MNRKLLFILPTFLFVQYFAMDEHEYRAVCQTPTLSRQKMLICQKHKKRLMAREKIQLQRKTIQTKHTSGTVKSVEKKENISNTPPKHRPIENFKTERIAKRTQIKPYIPGAYRNSSSGEE
jgi:hypothetical protein